MTARRCSVCRTPEGTGKAELRPYGAGNALVCFRCAFASPEARRRTEQQFASQLDAAGSLAVLTKNGPKKARIRRTRRA